MCRVGTNDEGRMANVAGTAAARSAAGASIPARPDGITAGCDDDEARRPSSAARAGERSARGQVHREVAARVRRTAIRCEGCGARCEELEDYRVHPCAVRYR